MLGRFVLCANPSSWRRVVYGRLGAPLFVRGVLMADRLRPRQGQLPGGDRFWHNANETVCFGYRGRRRFLLERSVLLACLAWSSEMVRCNGDSISDEERALFDRMDELARSWVSVYGEHGR